MITEEHRKIIDQATYGLGSSNPLPKQPKHTSCHSFAGTDIRLSIDGKRWAVAQSLEFTYFLDGDDKKCFGTIVEVLMGQKVAEFLGKTVRLLAVGADEYGNLWTYFDEQVKFTDYSSAISIDIIVSEGKYTFELVEEKEDNGE